MDYYFQIVSIQYGIVDLHYTKWFYNVLFINALDYG